MTHLVLIAFGGALGALGRYGLVNFIGGRFYPWGTLSVNVIGSLVMGIAYIFIVEKMSIPSSLKPFIMTGFLGAFTTFSAFSLETWELFDRGELLLALTYVSASVVLSIAALFIGVFLARLTI